MPHKQVKRALEEGRVVKQNSCSQPMVEKALGRVRTAILDPSVDVLLVRARVRSAGFSSTLLVI